MDLKLYQGFTEYIIEHTGKLENDNIKARQLLREIKRRIRKELELNSYWQLLAHDFFLEHSIKDERITTDGVLREVEFSHNGESYKCVVNYIISGGRVFDSQSRLYQNVLDKDDETFVIETLKSFIDRYGNIETDSVFLVENYVVVRIRARIKYE